MKEGIIIINLKGKRVQEVKVSKFGNGAHAIIPKQISSKKIKILLKKPFHITEDKIELNLFGNELLERKPTKFGTGFHITLPKSEIDKKVRLIWEEKNG